MAATTGYFDRRNASSARVATSQLNLGANSPQTPQRGVSSTFSSPGAGYRAEEDYVVLEIGARHISAGFAGDSRPRCNIGFGEEESRRVGDFRKWLPGFEKTQRTHKRVSEWGTGHELWRMDIRDLNLGLTEDKFERAVREAYTRYLLLDPKSRKVLLAVPSILPHPLLASLLSVLFSNFQVPSIMLLPSPHLTILAAGQRSGIVIDIGWHETIITAIYEFRQVRQSRTTRAMKMVVYEMGKLLSNSLDGKGVPKTQTENGIQPDESKMEIEFDLVEDITMRLAWCDPDRRIESAVMQATDSHNVMSDIFPKDRNGIETDGKQNITAEELLFNIPPALNQPSTVQLPFSSFRLPVEAAFFAELHTPRIEDDEEQSIHHLLYDSLIALPSDVRASCMANIVITGGGSNIPGVKSRILNELYSIVEGRGWDPIWGAAADELKKRSMELYDNRRAVASPSKSPEIATSAGTLDVSEKTVSTNPIVFSPENNTTNEDSSREAAEERRKLFKGGIRCLESLGPWAGGSLAPGAKIKAVVDIEKDSFLQHGLAGAKKESEISTAKSRQSMGPGISRAAAHDGAAWTLSAWA